MLTRVMGTTGERLRIRIKYLHLRAMRLEKGAAQNIVSLVRGQRQILEGLWRLHFQEEPEELVCRSLNMIPADDEIIVKK